MLLQRIIEEYNLYEGLEITHNVKVSVDNLNTWLSLDNSIYFEERDTKIKMFVKKHISKKDFDIILERANNLGYFPSSQFTQGEIDKFDYNQVIKELETPNSYIEIFFDPKYDPQLSEWDLPDRAYHITPIKHEEKILKIGLAPRSKEKQTKHPDRIYFSKTIEDVEKLLDYKDFTGNDKLFTIFELDLKSLRDRRSIRYFSDPRYSDKGFYTYENISPQYLKVAKRIST